MKTATFLILAATALGAATETRIRFDLSGPWRFEPGYNGFIGAEAVAYDDTKWTPVVIPHTWDSVSKVTLRPNAWYRKHFTIPESARGKRVYVYFEGVYAVATVFVNGTRLGEHRGGYTAFVFDITQNSRVGADNVLAVMVSNAACVDCLPDAHLRFFNPYGGIYRNVSVIITDPVHIATTHYASSGVYITPLYSSPGYRIRVTAMTTNDTGQPSKVLIRHQIRDRSGKCFGSA